MNRFFVLWMVCMVAFTVQAQMVINEVLYDPSNLNLEGDANGDSVYHQEQDAFIELVNIGKEAIDISGYTVWDDSIKGEAQFVFPKATVIPPNTALVVFGGGKPSGDFGSAIVMVDSTTNGLSLGNSGEVIVVRDSFGRVVLSFNSDEKSNNPNTSYTRYSDRFGPFVKHNKVNSKLFSPGRAVNGGPFAKELSLQGIMDFSTPQGGLSGKGIHLVADSTLLDISRFGIGVANNGNGTQGRELELARRAVHRGDNILLVRDSLAMAAYLVECFAAFDVVLVDRSGVLNFNGDDAIELYRGTDVVTTYGDPLTDGTGEDWEYTDAWAYKADTGWQTGDLECTDETENIYYSQCVYPGCPAVPIRSIEVEGKGGVRVVPKPGDSLQMTAAIVPPYATDTRVIWSIGDSTIATIDSAGKLVALKKGKLTVRAAARDGSGVAGSVAVEIKGPVLTVVQENEEGVLLYPNPSGDYVGLFSKKKVECLSIYTLAGTCVKTVVDNFEKIDVRSLRPGLYIVENKLKSNVVSYHRLVVY